MWRRHLAHRVAQLLLIKMEDVHPRNKESDPAQPSERSRIHGGLLGEVGSNTTWATRRILDVHGNIT